MGSRERPTVETLFERFNIPGLPPLSSAVKLQDGQASQIVLGEVLKTERQQLLLQPLTIMRRTPVESRRADGEPRAKRVIHDIRERQLSLLLSEGPGMILAAVASNVGRKAKWTAKGLEGTQDWVRPSDEEVHWWNWFYRVMEANDGRKPLLANPNELNLLHAAFLIRFRHSKGRISLVDQRAFFEELDAWIPDDEELLGCLRQVAGAFQSRSK